MPAYVWDDQRRPLGHRAALRLADMCYISYIESEPALSPRGVVKRPSLTQLLRVRTDHKEDFYAKAMLQDGVFRHFSYHHGRLVSPIH